MNQRNSQSNKLSISVAIPIYNEESVLPELHRRLCQTLNQVDGDHEIIFVNDGSTDGTAEILSALILVDPRVKVIHLSRNFGHQAALSAALDEVSGDVLVLMDGDLQDTPETILQFVEKYRAGFDIVFAIRDKRKESFAKRFAYSAFYWLISKLSEIDLPQAAGDFGLLSRRAVESIRRCPERHRYLRGLRRWVGFRQIGITVERDARAGGVSKYSWLKLFRLAFDGIFSFSVQPLRAATWMGVLTITASIVYTLYAIAAHLFLSQSPAGFTALITAITFLAGVQLLFLGVIGEYVGRIYEQVKMRPLYVLDHVQTYENSPATADSFYEIVNGHQIISLERVDQIVEKHREPVKTISSQFVDAQSDPSQHTVSEATY